METIYDYFKNFNKIETSFFKIEREIMKINDFIVFRVFKKRMHEEKWQYIGMTYLDPEIVNKKVNKATFLYTYPQKDFIIKVHKTPTLSYYIRLIQTLLTIYLKNEINRLPIEKTSRSLNRNRKK